MSFWRALRIGSSALTAQRLRLDVIANNVANAETTSTAEGGPYQRQDVVFQTQSKQPFLGNLMLANRKINDNMLNLNGVRVSKIVTDDTPGAKVYDPTHPDADAEGFVLYPNVNLVVEMTNMLSATRSYEANLTVIDAARTMAQRALEIGR
ncbi:MAG TPA: flagellar basal body rod protein FlgC [Anaerolineaceae bacterium]|nr:flagellar basal body rod protein FlgC [Anaerolineaceae bacterium]HPN52566.1 flagellar basal body rod protein FlgC [Anaerolineaceae bacterium]